MKWSEADISLNHDIMASFSLHKWPWLPKSWASLAGVTVYKGATICPWDSIPMAQTLCIYLIRMWEAVWGGYQPQPCCCGIIFTPQMTLTSQIWGQLGRCNDMRVHPYSLETSYQWLKQFICLLWMYEVVWGGYQPQPWHCGIIFTPQWPWLPKSWAILANVTV